MALPKLSTPTHTITLPSTGKKIKFRPFLVKDEQTLLIAAESNENGEIFDSIKGVIKNCVLDDKFNLSDLTFFDFEYLFLNLRARSVGGKIDIEKPCSQCQKPMLGTVMIEDIKVNSKPKDGKVVLQGSIGLKLRYPNVDAMERMENMGTESADERNSIIYLCTEYVYNGDDVTNIKDISSQEFNEFVGEFNNEQMKKVMDFFETMPRIETTIPFVCKDMVCSMGKSGEKQDITITGLNSFFG